MFLDKLNWRYAAKKMDPSKEVPQDKLDQIIDAVRMAPTSSGLQPFELIVVGNKELREKLRPHAWNQSQLTDGSHVLVFAAWDNYTEERINAVLAHMEAARGANEALTGYYENLKATYLPRDAQENHEHAARQAYIALGFALAAAAELEVDSTPIEGFSPEEFDKLLGLEDRGLRSVVVLALGYRQEDQDWLAKMPKVRKSREDMVEMRD